MGLPTAKVNQTFADFKNFNRISNIRDGRAVCAPSRLQLVQRDT
jgi:hypothetical protein